jgi:hypothetical protein
MFHQAPDPHLVWGFGVSAGGLPVKSGPCSKFCADRPPIVDPIVDHLGCLTQVAPGAPRSAPEGPPERSVQLAEPQVAPHATGTRPGATWGDLGCLWAGLNPVRPGRLPLLPRPGRSPHMTDTSTRKPQGITATLTTDTMLTISEIVSLTGRDRKTVSDWIRAGNRYPNAVQDPTGRKAWRVPVKDLLAAGDLEPSQVVEVPAALESLREAKQVGQLRARIVELEKALEVQTARAEERQVTIATLQVLLSTLVPSTPTVVSR